MKLIFLLFISMFLISFASAGDLIQPIEQFKEFDLIQSCEDCTFVELTSMTYPNGNQLEMSKNMTKAGEDYTYRFGNTSQLGTYKYNTCGDLLRTASNTRVLTCETISFEVTPSGFSGTLGFYILFLILSLGVIILGFSLSDPIIVLLGSFGLYFVGLYILLNGIVGMRDVVYTWAIGIIILMLAAYISTRTAYEILSD